MVERALPVVVANDVQPSHLAQVNIGRLRYPVGSPELLEFSAAFGRINLLAERSPGFVWRHPSEGGHLDGGALWDDPLLFVNVTVWQSYEHLHDFTYRTAHGQFVRRRREWFVPMSPPTTALWWIPVDERPTIDQAIARVRQLRRYGPTPQVFTLRRRFDPSGRPEPSRPPRMTRSVSAG